MRNTYRATESRMIASYIQCAAALCLCHTISCQVEIPSSPFHFLSYRTIDIIGVYHGQQKAKKIPGGKIRKNTKDMSCLKFKFSKLNLLLGSTFITKFLVYQ